MILYVLLNAYSHIIFLPRLDKFHSICGRTQAFRNSIDSRSLIKSVGSGHRSAGDHEDNVESSVINKGGCSDRRRGARIGTSLNSKGRKPCRVDSRDSAQTYFHVTSIPFIDSIFARNEKEKEREPSPSSQSSVVSRFVRYWFGFLSTNNNIQNWDVIKIAQILYFKTLINVKYSFWKYRTVIFTWYYL